MTEHLTDARFNEIQAMEPADHAPQEIGTAILDLAREIQRLRAALTEHTHPVATCSACHHIAPWHVGSLDHAERPCTQHACGCTDLTTEA